MSLFTDAFAASNAAWERVAGEPFVFQDRTFTATTIEELTVETRTMLGGVFRDAASRMLLSAATVAASGIVKGGIVTARGVRLRVQNEPVDTDGDGTRWLALGPVQLRVSL